MLACQTFHEQAPDPPSSYLYPSACCLQARGMIVERAETIGLDWSGAMRDMQAQDWPARMRAVQNSSVSFPSYYTQPFHAYSEVCDLARTWVWLSILRFSLHDGPLGRVKP